MHRLLKNWGCNISARFHHIRCHVSHVLHAVFKCIKPRSGHVSVLSMCVTITTAQLHWKKVCASACSIDHSSTASLCTSTVPERLVEQQTSTAAQWPRIPDPPPSPSPTGPPLSPWPDPPPKKKYSYVVQCEWITWLLVHQLKCVCSMLIVLKDFASINRKLEGITFWNSA